MTAESDGENQKACRPARHSRKLGTELVDIHVRPPPSFGA